MKVLFRFLLVCLLPGPALAQTTWYADASVPGPGSGTQTDPYRSVGFALGQTSTVAGDTVLVAPGVYVDESVNFLGKDVTVESTGGAAATVLEGNAAVSQSVVVFANGESPLARLAGFTIRGGTGTPLASSTAGGGIYCESASPTLESLVIRDNVGADFGAGSYFSNSFSIIANCEWIGNGSFATTTFAAGIYALDSNLQLDRVRIQGHERTGLFLIGGTLQMRHSIISGNTNSSVSAGCYFQGAATSLQSCVIEGNVSRGNGSGIYNTMGNLTVLDCVFDDQGILNSTGDGGAIYQLSGVLRVERCAFSRNHGGVGGALNVETNASAQILDCSFVGNTGSLGGAISALGALQIRNCSFIENEVFGFAGGALTAGTGSVVERSVFFRNSLRDFSMAWGGAVFGPVQLDHCVLVDNSVSIPGLGFGVGGGAHSSTLTNCIVYGNSSDMVGTENLGGANVNATYCLVGGGWPGIGNIQSDPMFVDLQGGDFHLLPGSPAVDAGDPGAPLDPDQTRADMGVYPFDASYCSTGCVGDSFCSANPNSTGQAVQISASGSPVLANNQLVLEATQVPPGEMGFFVLGSDSDFVPFFGSSQGHLCMGGQLIRLNDVINFANMQGVVQRTINLTGLPQSPLLSPGSTWHFQYWYRDQNPMPTSNMSQGLSVTWQ